VIVEDDKFRLSAFSVTHRGPDCFGFLFEEKPRRPFLAAKAEELGVPFGPERAKLVRGETITLKDGRMISPDDVLGGVIPGTRYVHIGDTGRTDNLINVCRDADALTIEATYLETEADMARRFGHLTAAQAARLALDAGVKTLILTHISRRYFEREVIHEARSIFPNTYVARDFDHYLITRESVTRLKKENG
jgi:ribonuclease Z